MKKYLIPAAIVLATLVAASAKKKDATLMTVNGKDVTVSEFQYLYEKNNQQQAEPQSLDEYLDMFIKYKLKVADAEAAGIDTTASFIKEYTGYCDDLAKPYMTDSTVVDRLRHEAYARMENMVDVSHILLPYGQTPDQREANRQRLDSIRTAIVNGADFGEMARRFSADRSAQRNGGHLGFFLPGRYPFPFEEAAYSTAKGQISPVVDDAPYGWHIIRVEDVKPNPGQVEARHILMLTRGLDEEAAAAKKVQIDSIYNLLVNGGDFEAIAKASSEDPGSARNGGMLPWFGPGQMVKEFEDAAFSLADGQISKPFQTSYGWHIVQTLHHRPLGSYEEMLPQIDRAMQQDRRSQAPRDAKIAELRSTYKAKLDPKGIDRAMSIVNRHNGLDSIARMEMAQDYTTVGTVNGRKVFQVKDVEAALPAYNASVSPAAARAEFERAANQLLDDAVVNVARENLADADASYRNLIHEYRDGILLFDISNRNVWDKSNKDVEGLEAYFDAHRADYKWDTPRYKGIIISATSDSVAAAAKEYLAANPTTLDSLVTKLRSQFGRNIKVERKIFPKGEDAVVDYIAFEGPRPAAQGKWTSFFAYEGEVLDAPREAADVRVQVVNDYQNALEQQWLERLRKDYPVKINKKELEKLRKHYAGPTDKK